jgi:oligosaccharide repeat unit polymerase
MQGFNIDEVGSLEDAAIVASRMSVQRYSAAGQATTLLLQLLLSLSLLGPLLGGTLFVRRQGALDTALALSTMSPCLVLFVMQSTRSSVLYSAVMWMAGYMSTRVWCGMKGARVNARVLGIGVLFVLFSLFLTRVGDLLRLGSAPTAGDMEAGVFTDRVKVIMFGHILAFSTWFDSADLMNINPAVGRHTVAGLFEAVSPGSRASGVYTEPVPVGPGFSNVFTIFRGLIDDFTLFGSLAVVLVVSFCAGVAYRRVQQHEAHWIGALAGFYALTLWYVVSIFNYNSVLLALTTYSVIWMAQQRPRRVAAWAR